MVRALLRSKDEDPGHGPTSVHRSVDCGLVRVVTSIAHNRCFFPIWLGWMMLGGGVLFFAFGVLDNVRPSFGYVDYILGRLPDLRDWPGLPAYRYS